MPWYCVVFLVCLAIGPFDALYLHIRAERRRDEIRRKQAQADAENKEQRGQT